LCTRARLIYIPLAVRPGAPGLDFQTWDSMNPYFPYVSFLNRAAPTAACP
jgi:hypothetical protein